MVVSLAATNLFEIIVFKLNQINCFGIVNFAIINKLHLTAHIYWEVYALKGINNFKCTQTAQLKVTEKHCILY